MANDLEYTGILELRRDTGFSNPLILSIRVTVYVPF